MTKEYFNFYKGASPLKPPRRGFVLDGGGALCWMAEGLCVGWRRGFVLDDGGALCWMAELDDGVG